MGEGEEEKPVERSKRTNPSRNVGPALTSSAERLKKNVPLHKIAQNLRKRAAQIEVLWVDVDVTKTNDGVSATQPFLASKAIWICCLGDRVWWRKS